MLPDELLQMVVFGIANHGPESVDTHCQPDLHEDEAQ
jgi:hypothetical protein